MDIDRRQFKVRTVVATIALLCVFGLFLGASSIRSVKKLVVLDEALFKGNAVVINDSGLVLDSIAAKYYESDIPMSSLTHGSSIPTVEEMGSTEFYLPSWSGTSMNMISGTKLIPPDAMLNDSISLILRCAVNSQDATHNFYLRFKYRMETDDSVLVNYDTLYQTLSANHTPYKFFSVLIGKIYYTTPKTTILFKLSRETGESQDNYTDKIFTSLFSIKYRRDKIGMSN